MCDKNNVIRLRYMGEENYALGLEHGKVYVVSIICKSGYISVMWNTNECLYTSLENIVDEVAYSIQQENPNYHLIGREDILVTSNKYEGYQLLYENEVEN